VVELFAFQFVAPLYAVIVYYAATGHRCPHVAQSAGKAVAAPAVKDGFT
jgi:CBS domain-containing membrane protein